MSGLSYNEVLVCPKGYWGLKAHRRAVFKKTKAQTLKLLGAMKDASENPVRVTCENRREALKLYERIRNGRRAGVTRYDFIKQASIDGVFIHVWKTW